MRVIVAIRTILLSFVFLLLGESMLLSQTTARAYNEELLDAIRNDFARPTVHARNLFHISAAMYDAWAVFEEDHETVFLGDTIDGFFIEFLNFPIPESQELKSQQQEEVIAYAADRLIRYRFRNAPDKDEIIGSLDNLMQELGYDADLVSIDYINDQRPAILGNYIADRFIAYGNQDGANELNDYSNLRYSPVNPPMIVIRSGNTNVSDPNRWQPLAFDVFIGQSGFESPVNVPTFLSPEWGDVTPFAMNSDSSELKVDRFEREFRVYKDPGSPPELQLDGQGKQSDDFRYNFSLVGVWSSMMDVADSIRWDISPGAIGNINSLPSNPDEFYNLYNLFDGGDNSNGRTINPITNEPYDENIVLRGDYTRVLAEFWADGPDSETPPGHWFTILHKVMDDPLFVRQWQGMGEDLSELEYEVKAFLTLGGAMHDAAVATWSIKGWYDYARPITAIRFMASKGQSSDSAKANYDPRGLPLIEDYIESIEEGDALALIPDDIGKIKIKAWRGPDFIEDANNSTAGVGWIKAEYWWPYQRPTFVSPPFAGYVSGHSTFSRAAAEILTFMTGDEYFPGGMGTFEAPKDQFLVFENGPSETVQLQWATYRDASDQTSLSRIWGGIHPPIDDIPGRLIGIEVAIETWNKVNSYFSQTSSAISSQTIVEDGFSISPNPVSRNNKLTINSYEKSSEPIRVSVFDINGRLMRSEIIRPHLTSLDIDGLLPGSYYMNLSNSKIQQIEKLIIID